MAAPTRPRASAEFPESGPEPAAESIESLESLYFSEMGSIPRISREEEIELAGRIEEARQGLTALFDRPPAAIPAVLGEDFTVPRGPSMEHTLPERVACAILADLEEALDDGDLRAARRRVLERYRGDLRGALSEVDAAKALLTEANLRLVVHLARQHPRRLPMMDLIQEGNLGLMKAVERFNADLGFRFSTYAAWWIHQNMRRGSEFQSDVVRVPAPSSRRRRAGAGADDAPKEKPLPPWKRRERGEPMGSTAEGDEPLRRRRVTVLPLDAPVWNDSNETLQDRLVNEEQGAEFALEQVARAQIGEVLGATLSELEDRDRHVLTRRFGLDGEAPETLRQLAARLSLSRERIRQIELGAIGTVRRQLGDLGIDGLQV